MSLAYSRAEKPVDDSDRYDRRLSDKVLVAFDHACADGEWEIARNLLDTLEGVLLRAQSNKRRREPIIELLVQAHNQLWHARNSDLGTTEPGQAARKPLPLARTGSLLSRQG